jgi:tRNA (guanine-N7-)-methyltransferase
VTEPGSPLDVSPYTLDPPTAVVCWLDVFGVEGAVELEVGSGKGLFLANAAAAAPSTNFLGIELSGKFARKAADRVAKRGLRNVRVLAGDARRFLHEFVPPETLSAVHIYFPDPWWKKRHKKRRVFCEPFVEDVARGLRPAGAFHMATDVEEYFGVMKAIMDRHPGFIEHCPPTPRAPVHDLDYLTNFERKYRLEGRPIFRAIYCLVEPVPKNRAGST